MVETSYKPFDTHIQQLEAEGPVTYERMVELVATLQQQWRFPLDKTEMLEQVYAAEPGVIRSQAISHAVNTYFQRANSYLEMMRELFPWDAEQILERGKQVEGYENAIHFLKRLAVTGVFEQGTELLDALWGTDTEEVQESVRDCVIRYLGTPQGKVSQHLLGEQRFQYLENLPVKQREGQAVFRYWGRDVTIPAELGEVHSIREMTSGHAVFVQGNDGRRHIIKVMLPETSRDDLIAGELVTIDEFDTRYYFGEQTSLDAIGKCLDDVQFQGFLSMCCGSNVNMDILPIYGRARLRECWKNPELKPVVVRFLARHGADALYVFNCMRVDELEELLPALEKLHRLEARKNSEDPFKRTLENSLVSSFAYANLEAFDITQAGDSEEEFRIVRLLEKRLRKQLQEVIPVITSIDSDGEMTDLEENDIEMVARSFEMVSRSASNSVHVARGLPLDVQYEKDHLTAEDVLQVYDFIKRHPQATGIFQANLEFVHTVLMAQEQNPLIGQMEAEKPAMYQKLAEGKKLHEVPTTDTATDTARAVSLLQDAIENHGLPEEGMRILFVGMNTAERFEKPVVNKLRRNGVKFGAIIGIDQNDFSDEARQNLDMQEGEKFSYFTGNLQEDEFPELEKDGQVDAVVLPWSMLNDLLKTMSFAQVLYKLRSYMKQGAVLITDNPIPAGKHSYEAQLRAAAEKGLPFGHVLRTLQASGEDVETMFAIYHMQFITMHLMSLGMEPLNVPASLEEQSHIAQALSEDDSELAERHKQGIDIDAVEYPVYQANGANRMTLAAKLAGVDKIIEKHGIFPMWIYERAIRPGRQKLAA